MLVVLLGLFNGNYSMEKTTNTYKKYTYALKIYTSIPTTHTDLQKIK